MSTQTTPSTHPLDPPTAAELTAATALLAREKGVGDGWRLTAMELVEPSKAAVDAAEQGGEQPPRRLRVVAYEQAATLTHVALVRLDGAGAVLESWEDVPGVQPNVTVDEWTEADAALRAHPDVVAALAARGVTDLDLVFMDTWCFSGPLVPERWAGRRIGWSDTWVRKAPGANPYAGPVGGFHCLVDLGTMELLEIEDDPAGAAVPRPSVMGEYVPSLVPAELREASTRPPVAPLDVTQPDGPGFTVEGNLVTWQNWSVRVGFTGREGLVLHRLTYRDGDRVRSVAGRMSFAEMVVPYRDPSVDHARRTAFDIGEWGLGFMTTSLELGCDCLGEIRYLDATLHDSHGAPYTIRNAICLHEEDDAVLWKHVDHGGAAEVRRSRRFVISFHVTVANYEYLVYWRLYQDGTIECEVRATGIMVVTAVAPGRSTRTARSSTSGPTRRSTSTSSSPGSTSTSTAARTPSSAPRRGSRPPARATPTGSVSSRPPSRSSRRGTTTCPGRPSAPGRSSTSARPTASGRTRPTSSSRAARSPRCSPPGHLSSSGPASSATPCG